MIRIVLIADESDSAQDIQGQLERVSYEVTAVTATVDDVITHADDLRPDIILMDVRLKGEMDGIEAAQQIKRLHDIPIIFITADTDEATVRRAIAAEPDGVLIKPLDELELIAAIDVAIKKHQKERQARVSERRIRELTDSITDVICETDANGAFTYVNTACLGVFGYTKEELEAGLTFFDVIVPDELSEAQKTFEKRMDDEEIGRREYTGLRKDGSTFPFAVRATIIERDGGIAGIRGIILDITAEKHAERVKSEYDELIHKTYSTTADGVVIAGLNNEIIDCNNALAHMYGVSKEEMISTRLTDLLPHEELTEALAGRSNILETKGARIERKGLRKNGEEFVVESNVSMMKDDSGAPLAFVAVVRDITERKRVEEELEIAARLPAENPSPVIRLSGDGAPLYANEAGSAMLERYLDNVRESALTLLRPASVDALKAKAVRQIELGVDDHTFEFSVVPIVDRQYVNFYGIDITERKRSEQELRESERHIRELTDSLPMVVFEADETGRITFVNATAFDMFGYTKEELKAGMTVFQLITPVDRERGGTAFRRRTSGYDIGPIEYTGLRKDGSTFPFSVRAVPVRRNGVVIGVRGIIVDITERKLAEKELAWELAVNSTIARLYTPLIAPTSTIEDIALAILNEAKLLTGSEHGFVALIDPVNRDMVAFGLTQMMLSECAIPEEKRQIRFPIGADGSYPSLWGHALNTKKGFYTNAPATHPVARGTPDEHTPLAQFLAAPALVGDNVDGQIALANPGRDYTERDLTAVERLADVYALAVVRTREEETIKSTLKERETLLKEIHHRVKNNLQIISSLLSLQAGQATERETIEMLNESQRRIRSMALVHEKLYRSDSLADIDFGDYVESFVDELLRMFNVPLGAITITVDIKNVRLGVDTAIPCALIINELVSNSLKYAFTDGQTGDVTIALQRANGAHTLTVADNGVGFPLTWTFGRPTRWVCSS